MTEEKVNNIIDAITQMIYAAINDPECETSMFRDAVKDLKSALMEQGK